MKKTQEIVALVVVSYVTVFAITSLTRLSISGVKAIKNHKK